MMPPPHSGSGHTLGGGARTDLPRRNGHGLSTRLRRPKIRPYGRGLGLGYPLILTKGFWVVGHLMLFISKADCNSARTVPGKSRASLRSSRTRASFSRSVSAVGARYSSSAPRARFGRSPYPPVGVDPPGRPSGSSPKSRCRTTPPGSLREYAPKAPDRSPRPGYRWRRPQPGGYADTKPTKSSVFVAFRRRTTTAHPVPGFPPRWRQEPGFVPKEAIQPLFLSQLVTVLRETPKIRLMPRKEARSW
jgi:hypothetical protein